MELLTFALTRIVFVILNVPEMSTKIAVYFCVNILPAPKAKHHVEIGFPLVGRIKNPSM